MFLIICRFLFAGAGNKTFMHYYCPALLTLPAKLYLYKGMDYANCNHQQKPFKEVTHEKDIQ